MEAKLKMISKTLLFLFFLLFINQNSFGSNLQNFLKQEEDRYKEDEIDDKNEYPFVQFDLKTEGFFQNSQNKNYLFTQTDLAIDMNFNRFFTIHTNFGIEKIKGNLFNPISLKAKENESPLYGTSLTARELSAVLKFDKVHFYLGKIEPRFGAGSERWSSFFDNNWYGISGTFLNRGYALEEKVGILTRIAFLEREDAKVSLEASIFTNDNSVLFKKPFFVQRDIEGSITPTGQKKRLAGSDLNILNSFAISGRGFLGLRDGEALSFNVGFKRQGSKADASESGATAAIQYTKLFFEHLKFSVFGEYAKIWNAYAIKDLSEQYITGSISLAVHGFVIGAVYNDYQPQNTNLVSKIRLFEYFVGFEPPKTNFGIFVSRQEYKFSESNPSGFAVNVRYRII